MSKNAATAKAYLPRLCNDTQKGQTLQHALLTRFRDKPWFFVFFLVRNVVFSKCITYNYSFTKCYNIRPIFFFTNILDVYDHSIPCVNNIRIIIWFFAKYNTVLCNVRYGTCTVFMVQANASIPHVTWIIAFTRFYILLQSSILSSFHR